MHTRVRVHVCVSSSVMSDSLRPHGLGPARLLCPWDFPDKNTGVGCHSLLQGIFLTQGLNPGLLHCSQTLYRLSHYMCLYTHTQTLTHTHTHTHTLSFLSCHPLIPHLSLPRNGVLADSLTKHCLFLMRNWVQKPSGNVLNCSTRQA